jgi:hypothetical protein
MSENKAATSSLEEKFPVPVPLALSMNVRKNGVDGAQSWRSPMTESLQQVHHRYT